jgi:hypothetical protein
MRCLLLTEIVVVVYWINVDAISKMIYDTDERTQVHSARPSLAVTHQPRSTCLNFSERATELALVVTAPLSRDCIQCKKTLNVVKVRVISFHSLE